MICTRAVNEVLDQLVTLDGKPTRLEGILEVHDEGYELKHYPKLGRRPEFTEDSYSYRSGIWVEFGNGSIRPNKAVLACWQGKRVRVTGVVYGLASLSSFGAVGKGGFGPWGFWPAAIEAYSIQRVTAEERREEDT